MRRAFGVLKSRYALRMVRASEKSFRRTCMGGDSYFVAYRSWRILPYGSREQNWSADDEP